MHLGQSHESTVEYTGLDVPDVLRLATSTETVVLKFIIRVIINASAVEVPQ